MIYPSLKSVFAFVPAPTLMSRAVDARDEGKHRF